MNPTEYIWGHLKQHEIESLPQKPWRVEPASNPSPQTMHRRPTLVIAFWQQAQLFPL
jgi:hypothetical protein